MKKFLLTMVFMCLCSLCIQAQNDTILTIEEVSVSPTVRICANLYDRVLIYAPENCNDFGWAINGETINNQSPVIFDKNVTDYYWGSFGGCGYGFYFELSFIQPYASSETTTLLWKHPNEVLELNLDTIPKPPGNMWQWTLNEYLWSTGETTQNITVVDPGTYTCNITNMCSDVTKTFIVQDNVEIDLATCDLESNLNMVTWDVTEAQAEYIDHLRVKRDGLEVGTANYIDGYYIDNIGSGAASRTYTITAVTKDGEDCPIVSYPKETIHMAYLTGINNTIEVNWNTPTGYDLLGYNVCEWTPNGKDGELTIIDFVGAGVTSYTCTENLFNNGHVVVQGVENGKTESRLLSNRSEEGIMGIDELQKQNFKIYPNPSTGEFTVEGASSLTVYNTLGQIIATSHSETDTHSFSLRSGIYFIKSDEGVVKKVIVE